MLEGTVHAPEFPTGLDWLNTDKPFRIRDLRGKFVLLDFWTYCCINCMHILPDLRRLEEKYAQELVVVGVHSAKFTNEKDTSQIRQAILRYRIEHPVVNDSNFEIWQSYGANAWPTLVLINPLGKIIAQRAGEVIFEPFDAVLSAAIPYFEGKGKLVRSPLKLTLEQARRANTLLNFPGKVAADEKNGRLFVTDSNNNRILIVSPAGMILDVIGSGTAGQRDGGFDQAEFNHPQGVYSEGDTLYIADTENHLVRVADLGARTVKTVLGTGTQAKRLIVAGRGRSVGVASPWDVLAHEGKLYIAMAGFHQIWVADTKSWEARPYAGSGYEDIRDGALLEAALAQPSGLATNGSELLFADSETSAVRVADLSHGGHVKTLVGAGLFKFGDINGDTRRARFQHPLGVAFREKLIYVADTYNSKIKVIDAARGVVTTLAGNGKKELADGAYNRAAFNEPGGLAWLGGKLYVADTNNHQIRVLDPVRKTVSTLEFSGLEKLSRRQMETFRGREVDLGRHEVSGDAAQLAVTVKPPDGYKFASDAPFFLRWSAADESAVQFGLQPDQVDFESVRFPLNIPIAVRGEGAEVLIDTIVYYCTDSSSACYVDRIRARLMLQPAPQGSSRVPVLITARVPGMLASAR